MTIELSLKIIYLHTILSAVIAGVSFFKFKKRTTSTRLIGLLFFCSFLSNTATYVFVMVLSRNGNIFIGIYGLILILIITALFNFNTHKKYATWFAVIALAFLVPASINLLFIQKSDGFSYNLLAASFVIIAYCLFYFHRLITELPARQIHMLPMFWFSSAFLFYHSATLFLFAFRDYLIVVLKDDMIAYWAFHNIVSIVQQCLILVGLYYDIKYPTTSGPGPLRAN